MKILISCIVVLEIFVGTSKKGFRERCEVIKSLFKQQVCVPVGDGHARLHLARHFSLSKASD